jgi:hypothetical protein
MKVVELFIVRFSLMSGTYFCRAKIAKAKPDHRPSSEQRTITEGEVPMIIRGLITAAALFFAGYAFWDGVFDLGHVLNPFGILFLFLSGAVWLGWKPLNEIFKSGGWEDSLHPMSSMKRMEDIKPSWHRRRRPSK